MHHSSLLLAQRIRRGHEAPRVNANVMRPTAQEQNERLKRLEEERAHTVRPDVLRPPLTTVTTIAGQRGENDGSENEERHPQPHHPSPSLPLPLPIP